MTQTWDRNCKRSIVAFYREIPWPWEFLLNSSLMELLAKQGLKSLGYTPHKRRIWSRYPIWYWVIYYGFRVNSF